MEQLFADQPMIETPHPGLEALDDGFFMVDAEWRVTYWNAAAERLLHISRSAVLGRDLFGTLPFLQDSSSRDMLPRAAARKRPERYLDIFPDVFNGFVSVHAAPLPNGGLAVQFRDATEEVKQAEQYSSLLETLQDGFVALDTEWRIVYVNAAAESLLRLRRDRARNVAIWSFLPREPAEIGESLRATMGDGLRRHLEAVRPEGRVFRGRAYDLWIYPLAGGGISILFEDVSERVAHEKKLARLAKEAQEANRAKSRFFAAISHELRTPLNAIVGYTHLLQSGTYGELPTQAQRAAERAGVCAEHLGRLVDDLLLLTATEVGRINVSLSPVDLRSILPSAVAPYRIQAEAKGLHFGIEVAEFLPPVLTDPDRLRQLLAALLANAVKYTLRGAVTVRAAVDEDRLLLSVEDTGPGVADADRERIFGPFEQVGDPARSNPLARGAGLGLTVARQLAILLQGALVLERSDAGGSVFSVTLPLARLPDAGAAAPAGSGA
jgi:PAS domain S-box-containing protein